MSGRRRARVCPEKLATFLEAAYDVVADDQRWLRIVVEAALEVWGWGREAHAAIYDASNVAAVEIKNVEFVGLSPPAVDGIMRGLGQFTPEFVTRTFRMVLANGIREVAYPEMKPMVDELGAFGFADAFSLNGLDPGGRGVLIGMWSYRMIELSPGELALLRRMAHHLGAAHRVRRRLRESQPASPRPDSTVGAEAILDARRRIVHAAGPARSKGARDELLATAAARDRERAPNLDPGQRLVWGPLTRARWTLVDSFESDGARYVVARENQSSVHGLEALTERERQAVAYLAIGQSTKETAYALGIADATVRVLLGRAAAKLGVRSRSALLAHPEVSGLCRGGGRG
jgi:DNA-binding CsgD family transcriptional regulator